MCLYCEGNGNDISWDYDKKTVLITIVITVPNKEENNVIFLFSHFFFGA